MISAEFLSDLSKTSRVIVILMWICTQEYWLVWDLDDWSSRVYKQWSVFQRWREIVVPKHLSLSLCAPQFSIKISIFGNGMEFSNAGSCESIRSIPLVLFGLCLSESDNVLSFFCLREKIRETAFSFQLWCTTALKKNYYIRIIFLKFTGIFCTVRMFSASFILPQCLLEKLQFLELKLLRNLRYQRLLTF